MEETIVNKLASMVKTMEKDGLNPAILIVGEKEREELISYWIKLGINLEDKDDSNIGTINISGTSVTFIFVKQKSYLKMYADKKLDESSIK